VRYLGGDLSLVHEVCMIRGFQEQLAVVKKLVVTGGIGRHEKRHGARLIQTLPELALSHG
jgi:hypothetical protein